MLTTMDLVGCCCPWACWWWWWPGWPPGPPMGSVLGILIEDLPSLNFSKPVISSTLANFTEVSEIVLSLFTGLCVLVGKVWWWLLVVILSSISGSKISPMSNFSTAKNKLIIYYHSIIFVKPRSAINHLVEKINQVKNGELCSLNKFTGPIYFQYGPTTSIKLGQMSPRQIYGGASKVYKLHNIVPTQLSWDSS